jgi:hypothetical protein
MPQHNKIRHLENQLVLPMEAGSEERLRHLDSQARREIAQLLRLLIEERVATTTTWESDDDE